MSEKIIRRIGLSGSFGYGKTTFAHAITETASGKKLLESDHSFKPQDLWHSLESGYLRHYDCGCGLFCPLPSYKDNDAIERYGLPFTDIAEHPQRDRHSTNFDYLVFFRRKTPTARARTVTFVVPPERALTQKFQIFLDECAQWRTTPKATTALPSAMPI